MFSLANQAAIDVSQHMIGSAEVSKKKIQKEVNCASKKCEFICRLSPFIVACDACYVIIRSKMIYREVEDTQVHND